MTIYAQLIEVCNNGSKKLFTTAEIKSLMERRFGTNQKSVIPSDYCYNRRNAGVSKPKELFARVGSGEYRYLGPEYPYTGLVFSRPRGSDQDEVVGEWVDGNLRLYDEPKKATEADLKTANKPANVIRDEHGEKEYKFLPFSGEQLELIYEEYMRILDMEIAAFGCKPTETRHLIGRLGELYCARAVCGRLARRVNQQGFDVLGPDGQRISVKTTAQKSGFISLNKNTLDQVDSLMVIQYKNGALEIIYYGAISPAIEASRIWNNHFELDLSKAKRLVSIDLETP